MFTVEVSFMHQVFISYILSLTLDTPAAAFNVLDVEEGSSLERGNGNLP